MTRVSVVTVGQMGVMPGRFVPSSFMVLRSFSVMSCCVFVMFSCFMMMLCRFLRHSFSPNFAFRVLPSPAYPIEGITLDYDRQPVSNIRETM